MGEHQVVVIGAGQAGVASGLALKDRRIDALLVDRADEICAAWRGRYDRLRLNTSRTTSHLPGRRFAKGTPIFPTRDQMIEHIESSARAAGLTFQLGTSVERIARSNGGWTLSTSQGEIESPQVIVATGWEGEPFIPDWEGRERFEGELIHSAQYRNPERFVGKRVLVVGPGCSGMEIAHDLAEGGAAKVWLAIRTPPNIINRLGPGGIPGEWLALALLHLPMRFGDAFTRFGRRQDFGDLTEYGLPWPETGLMTSARRDGNVPAVVDREMIEAIKAGRVEVVRAVESLDEKGVILDDGTRIAPDAVISATGYRRNLEPVVGHLGVLDEHGGPKLMVKPAAPGLRFIGYTNLPGALGSMSKQAKKAARQIARELRMPRVDGRP